MLMPRERLLLHHRRQAFAQPAADGVDRSGADLNAKHLIQQAAHLAMAEVVCTPQQPHQSAELRAKASALHSREQRSAGGGLAVGADYPMELVLDHERLDLWNIDHLMAVRFWILTTKSLTATAPRSGEMRDDIRALLCW